MDIELIYRIVFSTLIDVSNVLRTTRISVGTLAELKTNKTFMDKI